MVTHTFGDAREVLDGDTISQWITVDGGNVTLDESQAAAYVKELAGKYDTAYKTKTLKTSYGKDVTISRAITAGRSARRRRRRRCSPS